MTRRPLTFERAFPHPVERVGAALERALREAPGWHLSEVDREGGLLRAFLRPGPFPWSDEAHIAIHPNGPGASSVAISLTPPFALSLPAPRRRQVEALLDAAEAFLER
jgi:hypothetical protein